MKTVIIALFFLFPFITGCCSGEPRKKNIDKQPQYDPEKAGAAIVERFDLTGKIVFTESNLRGTVYSYDLAHDNNYIYIRTGRITDKTLYVFEKQTMRKIRELPIVFPQEFNNMQNNDKFYLAQGFAVIDNQAFFILGSSYPPYITRLFSVDLRTGTARHIDEKTLGFELQEYYNFMGYKVKNNVLWFRIEDSTEKKTRVIIYTFQYNAESKTFTAVDKKTLGYEINRLNKEIHEKVDSSIQLEGSSVYGDECWNLYLYTNPRIFLGGVGREPYVALLDKRKTDALTKSISLIDLEYLLGPERLPQSLVYDPPYIWILNLENVEKEDGKIQMLKLLPND
jgi:hypothetical protein